MEERKKQAFREEGRRNRMVGVKRQLPLYSVKNSTVKWYQGICVGYWMEPDPRKHVIRVESPITGVG